MPSHFKSSSAASANSSFCTVVGRGLLSGTPVLPPAWRARWWAIQKRLRVAKVKQTGGGWGDAAAIRFHAGCVALESKPFASARSAETKEVCWSLLQSSDVSGCPWRAIVVTQTARLDFRIPLRVISLGDGSANFEARQSAGCRPSGKGRGAWPRRVPKFARAVTSAAMGLAILVGEQFHGVALGPAVPELFLNTAIAAWAICRR